MHELAIAESVVETVLARTGERPVSVVRLQVGRFTAVVPSALELCFDLAAAGTPLEGARLEVDTPAGRAHCRSCGTDFVLDEPFLLCACGSADVELRSGRELQVLSVDLVQEVG